MTELFIYFRVLLELRDVELPAEEETLTEDELLMEENEPLTWRCRNCNLEFTNSNDKEVHDNELEQHHWDVEVELW